MILGLILHNFAIAKKVEISFNSNLVIITGETGAGKSVIINGISVVCGGNTTTDMIRSGEESATVEASFLISNNEKAKSLLKSFSLYDDEDVLVISRTISKVKGKTIINGHLVSQKQLSLIGKTLVDLHGQHDIQSLLDKSSHLFYLDKFGFSRIADLKERVINNISKYKELKNYLKELEEMDNKAHAETDFINYEIAELEKAKLREGEEEELEEEYKLLTNAKEIIEKISTILQTFTEGDGSLLKQLSFSLNVLSQFESFVKEFKEIKGRIESDYVDLKECARDLENALSNIRLDPERLSFVEARLDEINRLKLKYKRNVSGLINYLEELKEKVKNFNDLSTKIEETRKEIADLEEQLKKDLIELSKIRREVAITFKEKVENELKDLAMESALFEVSLQVVEDPDGIEAEGRKLKLFSDGIDTCEFLISTNPPHDLKPISSIASGGELSRVMLAIKSVIADVDDIPVLAFDEVDAGIGGKTGEKVAEKLFNISKFRQVIVITHLPQIASLPGEHFTVEKIVEGNDTILKIKKLNEYERINEIARMISGSNVTETTIKQAKELLGRWQNENLSN